MGFGPHNSPIGKLLEHGPHKGGWQSQLNANRLESAFDLMKNDPRLGLGEALQQLDVDLSNLPQSVVNDIVRSQPPDVQARVEQWAGGNTGPQSPGPGSMPTPSTSPTGSPASIPVSTSSPATPGTVGLSGHAPSGNAYGLAGTPPGHLHHHGLGSGLDPARVVHGAVQNLTRTDGTPSPMIQRVFNGEGTRTEAAYNTTAVPRATGGESPRADPAQVVAMPRNANGEAHRAERAQHHQLPNSANLVQSRPDGNPVAQQATQAAHQAPGQIAQGSAAAQHALAQQAAPQGAAQAAGFSTQQATAQLAPQQAGNRQMGEQAAQQQLNPRAAEATFGSQRVQDPRPALAAADPRGFTPQQALPSQAVQPAQARPEVMANQILPQLAGLTVVANTQASVVNQLPGHNAIPAHPGAENAAQARDGLLAPAGHTLAGFLRRDHRGRAQILGKSIDWVLGMMPDARKRRADGEPEATSFQWLFWILTITAYGAIATAIVTMAPTGGSLLDARGYPSMGAYALIVGGIAAVASWLIGRRLANKR